MSDWLDISRDRREGLTPAIRVAIVLSILIHAAAMWRLPPVRLASPEKFGGDTSGPLSVYLAPPPSPPPAPSRAPAPQATPSPPSPPLQAPKSAPRPRSTPPVIARETPAIPPSTPSAAATAPASPADGDLSSYIEARRRARGESAPSARTATPAPLPEDENARANRIIASNLAPQHAMTFGYDPTQRGGVFQVERMSYDAAEFIFYGWHKEMRRNMAQLIEVRKGDNPDIRIAVIRKMISIIREYEQEEFVWESHRLRRNITLSARPRDSAGLEDFLMTEFFGSTR